MIDEGKPNKNANPNKTTPADGNLYKILDGLLKLIEEKLATDGLSPESLDRLMALTDELMAMEDLDDEGRKRLREAKEIVSKK